jgi:hypothetical protein
MLSLRHTNRHEIYISLMTSKWKWNIYRRHMLEWNSTLNPFKAARSEIALVSDPKTGEE